MNFKPTGQFNKPRGFWHSRTLWISVALTLAAVLVVVFSIGSGSALGRAAGGPTTVAGWFTQVFDEVGDFFNYTNRAALQDEIDTLTARIAELEREALDVSELQRENERLQGLLNSREAVTNIDSLHARVVAKSDGSWFTTFTLDQGSAAGVQENMPVVTQDGVVGRVIEVQADTCLVLGLVDSRSAISGLIERTRDVGIVRGNVDLGGSADSLRMLYLQNEVELTPGDVVLTSGLGGIYPRGLKIGTVLSVGREVDALEQYCAIEPAVDFLHLEDVLILLYANDPLADTAADEGAE